jgi:hypothetical protein
MPTYKNNTAFPITPPGSATYLAGEERVENDYLQYPNGLTLTAHAPAGFAGELLYSGVLPSGSISGLYQYNKIKIINISTASVHIQPNNDAVNYWLVPDGMVFTIDNTSPRAWYSCLITGTGAGTIMVYGDRQ